ncbi:hypothetical protein OUO20_10465 [Arthrobacter sp. FX8]|uniref:hypothetical protein n=1 Tax=Micrococcaceae TaxID=1268 RepID=UPI00037CB73E|nr:MULTISPECIES: hypothetical protein [unclassified Arthrobacter]KRE65090.1 hypothetical protein ASG79_14850 [Arthrobacter sp. Soil761]WAJ31660.1 hypothetical protein OUO20_10465 [Arthrobacter sp. FX8]BCW76419.1 hypothetical protein NicSoilB11_27440 [Arthrobacter sp. NicSoilB11]
MRTFVSAIATVLGILLAAVAVPAMWVDRNIVQEDGFVRLAAPLGKDSDFQRKLAAAAVGTIDTGSVPGFLSGLVQPMLEKAAESLTGLPGYPAAWEETLRRSHRLSFADPAASPQGGASASSLTLDVAPLVALGSEEISRTTRLPLDPPEQTLINVGQPVQRQWTERLATYAPMGYILAIGSAIAFLLALVAARRRWTVLLAAGLGGLALAGAWGLALQLGSARAQATDTGNAVANMFRDEFLAAAGTDFQTWIAAATVTGGVLMAAGVVTLFASRKRARASR